MRTVRSIWSAIFLTSVLSSAVVTAGFAQSPPKDLKLVNDHWTAWDPPAVIEEGAEVHIIVRGDTLWDLAERFYGDPYLWPQIWERNQYILDSHWIYPGDPLVLGLRVETAEDVLGEPGELGGGEGQDDERSAIFGPGGQSRFVQLGTPDDIYCSGFVGAREEEFSFQITGSEYQALGPTLRPNNRGRVVASFHKSEPVKVGMSNGDLVYVNGGRSAGIAPGDTFTAVDPGALVTHPISGQISGRMYEYLGWLRVLSVQDEGAIAEVVMTCLPIPVGSALMPFEEEPIPSERRTPLRPVNLPAPAEALQDAPVIVHAKSGLVTLGEDHVVFVDLSEADDVIPGDQFTIYRMNKPGNPPIILGELAILSVHAQSSVAKITESRYHIFPGDRLLPK